MPKAYAVVCYHSISDLQKLAAYAKPAPTATAPFGARYLAARDRCSRLMAAIRHS
jgi:uncharacterized protein (DUF1330 family)